MKNQKKLKPKNDLYTEIAGPVAERLPEDVQNFVGKIKQIYLTGDLITQHALYHKGIDSTPPDLSKISNYNGFIFNSNLDTEQGFQFVKQQKRYFEMTTFGVAQPLIQPQGMELYFQSKGRINNVDTNITWTKTSRSDLLLCSAQVFYHLRSKTFYWKNEYHHQLFCQKILFFPDWNQLFFNLSYALETSNHHFRIYTEKKINFLFGLYIKHLEAGWTLAPSDRFTLEAWFQNPTWGQYFTDSYHVHMQRKALQAAKQNNQPQKYLESVHLIQALGLYRMQQMQFAFNAQSQMQTDNNTTSAHNSEIQNAQVNNSPMQTVTDTAINNSANITEDQAQLEHNQKPTIIITQDAPIHPALTNVGEQNSSIKDEEEDDDDTPHENTGQDSKSDNIEDESAEHNSESGEIEDENGEQDSEGDEIEDENAEQDSDSDDVEDENTGQDSKSDETQNEGALQDSKSDDVENKNAESKSNNDHASSKTTLHNLANNNAQTNRDLTKKTNPTLNAISEQQPQQPDMQLSKQTEITDVAFENAENNKNEFVVVNRSKHSKNDSALYEAAQKNFIKNQKILAAMKDRLNLLQQEAKNKDKDKDKDKDKQDKSSPPKPQSSSTAIRHSKKSKKHSNAKSSNDYEIEKVESEEDEKVVIQPARKKQAANSLWKTLQTITRWAYKHPILAIAGLISISGIATLMTRQQPEPVIRESNYLKHFDQIGGNASLTDANFVVIVDSPQDHNVRDFLDEFHPDILLLENVPLGQYVPCSTTCIGWDTISIDRALNEKYHIYEERAYANIVDTFTRFKQNKELSRFQQSVKVLAQGLDKNKAELEKIFGFTEESARTSIDRNNVEPQDKYRSVVVMKKHVDFFNIANLSVRQLAELFNRYEKEFKPVIQEYKPSPQELSSRVNSMYQAIDNFVSPVRKVALLVNDQVFRPYYQNFLAESKEKSNKAPDKSFMVLKSKKAAVNKK